MSTTKKRVMAYVVLGLSIAMSVKMVKDIIKLSKVDERLIEAQEELETAKEEREQLTQQLKAAEGGEWWEKQVRDTLKMAKKNEVVVVIPEEAQVSPEPMVRGQNEEEEQSNLTKWWQVFVY